MERTSEYRTLGRTGLKVSLLGLDVMTYGWGADKHAARSIFDLYREFGGNFFATADLYAGGDSETWVGEFVRESRSRDEVVIATKFSFNAQSGNPNAGGNGRKNILRALDGSLHRLQSDYVDLSERSKQAFLFRVLHDRQGIIEMPAYEFRFRKTEAFGRRTIAQRDHAIEAKTQNIKRGFIETVRWHDECRNGEML
jgi:hypothetical protein